jgi:hypothetical protein
MGMLRGADKVAAGARDFHDATGITAMRSHRWAITAMSCEMNSMASRPRPEIGEQIDVCAWMEHRGGDRLIRHDEFEPLPAPADAQRWRWPLTVRQAADPCIRFRVRGREELPRGHASRSERATPERPGLLMLSAMVMRGSEGRRGPELCVALLRGQAKQVDAVKQWCRKSVR